MALTTAYGTITTESTQVDAQVTWADYVLNWSTAPSFVTNISQGAVYQYNYNNGTAYRLVPTDGVSQDAFYSSFSGNALSNLIVSRSMTM